MNIVVQTSYQQDTIIIEDVDGVMSDDGALVTYINEQIEVEEEAFPRPGYGQPQMVKRPAVEQRVFAVFAPGAWLRYDVQWDEPA